MAHSPRQEGANPAPGSRHKNNLRGWQLQQAGVGVGCGPGPLRNAGIGSPGCGHTIRQNSRPRRRGDRIGRYLLHCISRLWHFSGMPSKSVSEPNGHSVASQFGGRPSSSNGGRLMPVRDSCYERTVMRQTCRSLSREQGFLDLHAL